MKNFKKLLVTMLALVLLICGITVVSFAADTPAEIIAEAQILLDQAANEDEFIAVRSQKMRALDKLIDANMANIKNSQEWREFQVGYRAAQNKLKEDSVIAANASFDKLLLRETSAAEAAALHSGLSQLVSLSSDGRGYFDTDSEAFDALLLRMKVAEVVAKLQTAEDTVVSKDKGASLLWVDNYRTQYLLEDTAVQALADYRVIEPWFDELYASVSDTLYAEIHALAEEACRSTTTFARGLVLADEIELYFSNCYFNKAQPAYARERLYANFARVYVYLNEIERSRVLVTQGSYLKELVALNNVTTLDKNSELYADYTARYNALLDMNDSGSVVSRLCALAEGYKKDVADVFKPGYAGPLTSAREIEAVVDELDGLIATCYFASTTYQNDLAAAQMYAKIYDFYTAMQKMETETELEDVIARNALYKAAVSDFNSLQNKVLGATEAYKNPLVTLYTDLISKAGTEINQILQGWVATAEAADEKDEEGNYIKNLEEAKAAYDNLQIYYLEKTTALYFSATENKTLTARIKTACQNVEERMLADFAQMLAAAKNTVVIPENLAEVDVEGLAARDAKLDELLALVDGLALSYVDVTVLVHELCVAKMLTILCKIEVEYVKPDGMDAAIAFYNELKTFTGAHIASINTDAEDYLAYAQLLNKLEVRMGDTNVPGAQQYLDALEAVVDNDNFDKVYALMHLDEYVRNNKIVRPDASDTTSASALFYQKYDELAGKVKAWRQAIVDEREANVSFSDYTNSSMNEYDGDTKQITAQIASNSFTAKDGREYGSEGSAYYATFEYLSGGGDGFMTANLPSSTENVVIEMDITTFTKWPSGGVSFNSGTTGLDTGKRMYPWIGAISGSGQIIAPNGKSHGNGPTLTNKEGGYIIPGQWTHFVIVYNAKEKMVSYYVNDEKIVDADGNDKWSCAQSEAFNFTEALRIGHSQGGSAAGSFSVDNLRLYIGDQPRNVNLFKSMSAIKKFAYYTDYVKKYIDSNGLEGSATDAKMCYEEIAALHVLYWGFKNEGDTDKTYLFDETTYWDPTVAGYVDPGITYTEFKKVIDDYNYVAAHADDVIEGALVEEVFKTLQSMMAQLETLTGLDNLTKRKSLLADFNAYIEANLSYIGQFNDEQVVAYQVFLAKRETVSTEINAYARANEYIEMVKKFAAARDLYSRTVYRSQAQSMMALMETDAALGSFNLNLIKQEVAAFAEAIVTFNEQSALLDAQLTQDNNDIIVDCMSRFPSTPEEAMKNYSYLNKYIVLVRRILLEGNYNPNNLLVQEALVVYEKMNPSFYDALQKDHAAYVQDLIDQFNAETSYIARLGIYTATKAYLEENEATIDRAHDSIKGIYSQYEIMDAQFGSSEGKEEQWQEYGKILEANALKFANLVVQMRFCESYAELVSLREQAAALYYYMDSASADAQLAVEYYHAYETLITQKALYSEAFIDVAYALKKANGMKETYFALLAAKAAFELADATYDGYLTFYEFGSDDKEYAVVFSMDEAVEVYRIALAQYSSFVTVINNEVNVVLDVVCSVRATYPVNQPIVALFKKYYD